MQDHITVEIAVFHYTRFILNEGGDSYEQRDDEFHLIFSCCLTSSFVNRTRYQDTFYIAKHSLHKLSPMLLCNNNDKTDDGDDDDNDDCE